jgi:phosphate/sulfate permease
MFKVIEYTLAAVLALVVSWNVHPFIAGVVSCLLAWALVEWITAKGDGDENA